MRRRTGWHALRIDSQAIGISGSSNVTVLSKDDLHEWSHTPTISRIVGTLYCGIGTADETTSIVNVWWGLICVSEDTASLALTTESLAENPWLYTGYLRNFHWGAQMPYWDGDSVERAPTAFPPFNEINWERFNTRVMRKVPSDCVLRLVTTTTTAGTAPSSITLHGYIRILLKED